MVQVRQYVEPTGVLDGVEALVKRHSPGSWLARREALSPILTSSYVCVQRQRREKLMQYYFKF